MLSGGGNLDLTVWIAGTILVCPQGGGVMCDVVLHFAPLLWYCRLDYYRAAGCWSPDLSIYLSILGSVFFFCFLIKQVVIQNEGME